MQDYKMYIPEGVQDFLPAECYNKTHVEQSIRKCFFENGYNEVDTPTFEYFDVFAKGIGAVRQEAMFKFFDHQGRILVLRPDITMPIARMVSTQMKDQAPPLRLFYVGNAYGYESAFSKEQKEFTQAGVELLGIPGASADAEVIALAIEALRGCGLSQFELELGQVEFFKGLMEEAGLPDELVEPVREAIHEKNTLSVEMILRETSVHQSLQQRIRELPMLFGGIEVLERARKFTSNQRALDALDNLEQIYALLSGFGLNDYVSIDLGLLHSIDYYSGIVFRGITPGLGSPLLSGGRYDSLLEEFSRPMPATGFALGIKRTLIALEKQGALQLLPEINVVISATPDKAALAYREKEYLCREGMRVILALDLDEAQLKLYADSLGARALFYE